MTLRRRINSQKKRLTFPRKLLKLYNVNIPEEGGDKLDVSDVRNLKHYVEKARKREIGDDEADSIPADFANEYRSQSMSILNGHIDGPNKRT